MDRCVFFKRMEHLSIDYKHPSYFMEKKLISAIKGGLEKEAVDALDAINSLERAVLADTPIRSLKNSLICSCTLFTRAVLDANVSPEDVFFQSDRFIMEIERINNIKALQAYEYHMVRVFIKMVNHSRVTRYSLPITRMIHYIHENITEKISLNVLSDLTHKTPPYLSSLFRREVGMSVTKYIHHQKIEKSKDYLEFTDMSIQDVASLFSFCNAGYYTNLFKSHIGMSPTSYRINKTLSRI